MILPILFRNFYSIYRIQSVQNNYDIVFDLSCHSTLTLILHFVIDSAKNLYSADSWLWRQRQPQGAWLFPDIFVSVSQVPHGQEAETEQSRAQQVTECRQERNDDVVRVVAPSPNKVHHPVGH